MFGFLTFAFAGDMNSKHYITQELVVTQERTPVLDGVFSCLPVIWVNCMENRLIRHFAGDWEVRFRVEQITYWDNRLIEERRSRDLKWVLNQHKYISLCTRKFRPDKCRTFTALENAKKAQIIYNYPLKRRWIVVDIYRDAQRRGIYPSLFTDPLVSVSYTHLTLPTKLEV